MLLPDNKSATSIPPPPYSPEAPPPGAGVPSMTPSVLPGQNHVHIHRANTPIHGSFLIDVSLPGGSGKNLSLESHNGLIDANVWVKGEAKRCELEAVSHNGVVRFGVADRETPIPVNILAKTYNGAVHTLIPVDFEGSLVIVNQNGSVGLLPSLREHAHLVSDEGGVRKYWVGGDYDEDEARDWLGDQCHVESMNGTVTVGYWEVEVEKEEQQAAEGKGDTKCGMWKFLCSS
ncbi:hypothetical protein CALCODRAFT_486935 [Calocera cornea HHB12733]|uniref:DUF7330 domain-containing protein n=1 Tax=Calocera cornea HHB12733 TaxID=1353952 RepID=A0A165DFK9_9BASI|nr:hypothetical protein CALCODRAFT_486935 [Calocera cornea HHB12733]